MGGGSATGKPYGLVLKVLTSCNLHDLGYNGSRYTWMNCRQDESFTKEHLDHAVANAK